VHRSSVNTEHRPTVRQKASARLSHASTFGQTSVIIRFKFHSLQFALRSVLTAQLFTAHWSHCSVTHRVALSALCCCHHSPITISTKSHGVTSYWHVADVIYNITYIAASNSRLQSRVHSPRVSVNIVAPKLHLRFWYTCHIMTSFCLCDKLNIVVISWRNKV